MTTLYEDLMDGFQEILESQRTGRKMKCTTLSVPDIPEFSQKDIRRIRNHAGMTQTVFAGYLGVSKKTVEAWEYGTNKPNGSARRLLALLDKGQEIIA